SNRELLAQKIVVELVKAEQKSVANFVSTPFLNWSESVAKYLNVFPWYKM
ncbi:unnamed protein product, partial [marine sediment metagenome]